MEGDWVTLAELKRARGLRGELFADPVGASFERFRPGLQATAAFGHDQRQVEVERSWVFKDRLVLKFVGIDSRTEAEQIQGWEMRVPASERIPLAEGEYYVSDLQGCRVETTGGRCLGEVTGWQDNGRQLLLEVGILLVPFVRAICTTIDPAGRRIVVELPEGLEEINA